MQRMPDRLAHVGQRGGLPDAAPFIGTGTLRDEGLGSPQRQRHPVAHPEARHIHRQARWIAVVDGPADDVARVHGSSLIAVSMACGSARRFRVSIGVGYPPQVCHPGARPSGTDRPGARESPPGWPGKHLLLAVAIVLVLNPTFPSLRQEWALADSESSRAGVVRRSTGPSPDTTWP